MKKIIKNISKNYLIILILLLSFFLRFIKLGSYPALNADEAAIGYNTYSLIKTGMDEHGNSWPIHFESFGDYKPGLSFYIVMPFVWAFGLNEWSVRIPGALFGVLTVYAIYLLTNLLLENRNVQIFQKRVGLGEVAALFLAISPWHIHFSRGMWEVNVASFLMVMGVYLFIKGLDSKKELMASAILFVLSLYTYHSARVVVPLLGISLVIIYWKKLFKREKARDLILTCVVGIVLLIPLVIDLVSGSVLARAAGVGLFADPGPISRINEQRGEHKDFSSLTPKILHNKFVNYGLAFFENWGEHFHGEFLFLSGDEIQRNKVPETGQMYLTDFIFLIVGLFFLIKTKEISKESKAVIFSWLFIAPTAAALTFQSPHALRAQNMVIPLVVLCAIGFSEVWEFLSKIKYKQLSYLLVVIMFWQFGRYEHMYWVHMSKEYPYSSQYGVKEMVNFVENNKMNGEKVLITTRYDQPYILYLFYSKYPPEKFQNHHVLTAPDEFGFSTVPEFGDYKFMKISPWSDIVGSYKNSLIVGTSEEVPEEANIIKDIYGTNGFRYFRIVRN